MMHMISLFRIMKLKTKNINHSDISNQKRKIKLILKMTNKQKNLMRIMTTNLMMKKNGNIQQRHRNLKLM